MRESFGIAALEARTFGLPVVARSQTGTGEFVRHGVNGLLAPDDRALARSLVLLGRNRDLLERMAMTNRDQPPEQTWPHVVARSLDLYRLAGAQAP